MRAKVRVKPFLKWAGGKFKLIDTICDHLPQGKKLIEPFLGSGAVFINTEYEHYLLSDVNPDLIHLYRTLKLKGDAFIDYCEQFFQPEHNKERKYYLYRDEFNQLEANDKKAALFLYLNRHGYNGLCRYNQAGQFNVPFGRYKHPYFPRKEMQFFHLKSKKATFICEDFASVMKRARKDNVVYCDPPYVPLSPTAYFTSYAQTGFSLHDQERLALLAEKLSSRGVSVVISNHENEITRRLYEKAKLEKFLVRRNISCNGKNRAFADELLAIYTDK